MELLILVKKIIKETEKIVTKTLKWAEQNNLTVQPMETFARINKEKEEKAKKQLEQQLKLLLNKKKNELP